jgi:hypothetical protein
MTAKVELAERSDLQRSQRCTMPLPGLAQPGPIEIDATRFAQGDLALCN